MAELVIENLDESVRLRLHELARDHGQSMSDEVRDILREAVQNSSSAGENLGTRFARRFAGRGLDQEIPELRGHIVQPISFDA